MSDHIGSPHPGRQGPAVISGYTITADGRPGSHDWGGEFHYTRESAEARAEELREICTLECSFAVVPCTVEIPSAAMGKDPSNAEKGP